MSNSSGEEKESVELLDSASKSDVKFFLEELLDVIDGNTKNTSYGKNIYPSIGSPKPAKNVYAYFHYGTATDSVEKDMTEEEQKEELKIKEFEMDVRFRNSFLKHVAKYQGEKQSSEERMLMLIKEIRKADSDIDKLFRDLENKLNEL